MSGADGDNTIPSPTESGEPQVEGRGLSAERLDMTYEIVERGAALGANPMARETVASRVVIDDPDKELVARWQKGDDAAFEELITRHERRIYRLLYRMMGNKEDAEDLTQETFLSLHRYGHRFRAEARFSTFVYRVAANAALNRRRSLGRGRARVEKLERRLGMNSSNSSKPPSSDPPGTKFS